MEGGKGGRWREHPSAQECALSGLAVTAWRAARTSPNPLVISPPPWCHHSSWCQELPQDYLFPPPLTSNSQVLQRSETADDVFSSRFLFLFLCCLIKSQKRSRCEIFPPTSFLARVSSSPAWICGVATESERPDETPAKHKVYPLFCGRLCKRRSSRNGRWKSWRGKKGAFVGVFFSVRAGVFIVLWSTEEEEEEGRMEEEEAQLKRMESGSLLAICAMCFSMSFLVMIPSSLLEKKKNNTKREKRVTHYFISYFVCFVM